MKRIVANLVVGPHLEDDTTSRVKGSPVNFVVFGALGFLVFRRGGCVTQAVDVILPHGFRRRRMIAVDCPQRGTQRPLARDAGLLTNGVIVVQVERLNERPQCEPLDDERAEHHRKCGEHDEITERGLR